MSRKKAGSLQKPSDLGTAKAEPRPWTVQDILGWLQAKRTKLLADLGAADKGPRGGGRPRGFQAEGATDAETALRGAAYCQGRVDADYLLPPLRLWHQDLQRLGVANLPPWTGQPQDETATLDLLNRMILACQRTDTTATPPAPQHPSLTDEGRYILTVLEAHCGKPLTYARILTESVRMEREDRTQVRRLSDSTIRTRVRVLLTYQLVARPPGTTKKGIAVTEKGSQALAFARGTERKLNGKSDTPSGLIGSWKRPDLLCCRWDRWLACSA